MKFLKRICGFLFSLTFIPAFSAFAETSQVYTDDFDRFTTDITMPWSGYGNTTYPSDVFVQYSGNYGVIDADGGIDGKTALKMTQYSSGHVQLGTKRLDVNDLQSPVISLSFDFKILQNASSDDRLINLGGNKAGNAPLFRLGIEDEIWKFKDVQGVYGSYEYGLDNWYRLNMTSPGNGLFGEIVDLTTNEVVIRSVNTGYNAQGVKELNALYMQLRSGDVCSIMIDNVVMTAYDAANDVPELINATIESDEENVQRNKELIFTFDQEIDESSTIVFKEKNGAAVDGAVTEKIMYNTLKVTYDGILGRNTDYVLSFEGVTNGNLSCTDGEINFKTEDLHLWNDINVTAKAVNDDESLTDITFEIGNQYNYPVFSGSVMAVVYSEEKMIAADIKSLDNVATGEMTVSFSLGSIPENAKIRIILMDVEKGPIPLASGMLEN